MKFHIMSEKWNVDVGEDMIVKPSITLRVRNVRQIWKFTFSSSHIKNNKKIVKKLINFNYLSLNLWSPVCILQLQYISVLTRHISSACQTYETIGNHIVQIWLEVKG